MRITVATAKPFAHGRTLGSGQHQSVGLVNETDRWERGMATAPVNLSLKSLCFGKRSEVRPLVIRLLPVPKGSSHDGLVLCVVSTWSFSIYSGENTIRIRIIHLSGSVAL